MGRVRSTVKGKYETMQEVYNALKRMRSDKLATVTHNGKPLHAVDRAELARLIDAQGCPFS